MQTGCTRREAIQTMLAGGLSTLWPAESWASAWAGAAADSLYRLAFTFPVMELVSDLEQTERGDPHEESETPYRHWYSAEIRRRFHGWGPKPRAYPPLADMDQRLAAWKRERVIATAARFLGYGYQHHHIPNWNPPANWPWKETCVGHNGKGVDCSNLTSFVYNQAFGIQMSSAIGRQSELAQALEGRRQTVSIRTVELPSGYLQRQKVLRSGDLVYIRGREGGSITHVVIWLGAIGHAASGTPLVIDSHGSGVDDDNGRPITCGVQLRPFRERSWYNRCASHAHRIFHD